jgi:hypothetical protein
MGPINYHEVNSNSENSTESNYVHVALHKAQHTTVRLTMVIFFALRFIMKNSINVCA